MKPMLLPACGLLLTACTAATSPAPATGSNGVPPIATPAPGPASSVTRSGDSPSAAHPGFCASGEEVVFGCSVGAGRTVALCASSDLARGAGSLEYREAGGGEPTRVWPTRAMAPSEAFRSGTLTYSGGGGAFLRFHDQGAAWTVYTGIGRGWNKAGVQVRSGDRVRDLACVSAAESRIGPELFERAGIAEDPQGFEIP